MRVARTQATLGDTTRRIRTPLVALSLSLVACAGSVHAPRTPRQTQCPDMNTCLMSASDYCSHHEFTMSVRDGSQSGPTVAQWRPSQDGQFHLLIACQ